MAFARVFIAATALCLFGYVQAAETDYGVEISGPDVIAHAGVSNEEARTHAEYLISEGQRMLESISESNVPVLRILRGPSKSGLSPRMQSNYPANRPLPPSMYPGGTSIALAENIYGDAIADSEAARGGTSIANSRTYSGTSIARSRSNRRLMMGPSKGGYYPNRSQYVPSHPVMGRPYGPPPPYYPGGTSIANAQNTWGDSIADSEAARGGTSIANSRTYSGTAIARSRSWRRLNEQ